MRELLLEVEDRECAIDGAPERPQLSIVIPVYGCTAALGELHRRLTTTLTQLRVTYEIVFVDDRGPDEPWPLLRQLADADTHVRPIRLSRNYGQQIAITAGLAQCRGERAVVMDCDLQDPPEFIPELWAAAEEGYHIVYASRAHGDPKRRKMLNRIYFAGLRYISGYDVDPGQGSFSLISRRVIDAFLTFSERERHYLFILRLVGFQSKAIPYARQERFAGESSYTLRKLLKHAAQGFFFQSTALLTIILWIGLFCAAASVVAGGYFIAHAFTTEPPPGWTALIVVQLLLSGVILTCLGFVGLYIARIFENSKGRPLYFVDPKS
jgi:dolichol-phosphate mannosyltransferase